MKFCKQYCPVNFEFFKKREILLLETTLHALITSAFRLIFLTFLSKVQVAKDTFHFALDEILMDWLKNMKFMISLLFRIQKVGHVLRCTPFDTSTESGRSKERYRLIALSSGSSIIAKLVTAILGLISIPLAITYLGKEQFGLWMVITSLVVWMQLADFGITNGLTNALAEAHGRDDKLAARSYISSALATTFIISIVSFFLVFFLTLWLPWGWILNLQESSLQHLARTSFLVAGCVFVAGIPVSVIAKVFIAYQIGYIANISQIITSVFSLIGLLLAIFFKLSMPWLVLLVSSGPVIGNLFLWATLKRFFPWCRLGWNLINYSALRRVALSSIPLFFFQIGALIINQFVNVIIAHLGSLNMVADYNVILKIYLLIFTLGICLSSPFYPAIREAHERAENSWVQRSIYRLVFIRIGVLLPPSIVLLFFGDWFITFWVHQPLDSRFGLFGWFTFLASLLLAALSSTFGDILISLDVIWPQIINIFISATIVLAGLYYFVPTIGLSGIFLSMSISTIYPIFWSFLKLNHKLKMGLV